MDTSLLHGLCCSRVETFTDRSIGSGRHCGGKVTDRTVLRSPVFLDVTPCHLPTGVLFIFFLICVRDAEKTVCGNII